MKRLIVMPNSLSNHGCVHGTVSTSVFPDGETAVMVPHIPNSDDVVLVGECSTAVASEMFLAAAYEIASRGPKSFTVVNTYFRHARSEREDGKWAAMAKFQARQWSGLGRIYPGVRLEFIDLHKDIIRYYFEGAVVTYNHGVRDVLEKAVMVNEDIARGSCVYATVDDGGVYEAKRLAEEAGVGFAHVEKKRLSGSETKVLNVHGDSVDGKTVVIFDDVISTGGSMVKAIQEYRDRGAKCVIAAATHGVFVGDAIDCMIEAGIRKIYVTDSHPNAIKMSFDDTEVLHLCPLNVTV